MQGSRKCHARLIIFLLLLTSSAWGSNRSRETEQNDKRTLLDHLLRVIGENDNHDQGGSKVSSSRLNSPVYFVDQGFQKLSSEERGASVSRLLSRRHTEILPYDYTLKDKIIQHFTGPVTFPSECSMHFHRLYHNTRDCSIPAYFKRCARLLRRLAMSPLCTQS
ncbi:ALK and LTK ligand 1 [Rhinatrema bivittatum]|uniref:ALK and LTK ligand 1 n=1 Tax=Rhinatrema bivittatum TaxID=194408 RepID=UPI00112BC8E7|nr:ALK and LTK ligand 1 [Rhinatrema bivittatum]XP_029447128.1 ALK and LTK ligand 1 [Rhinatrema bivittatum]